MRLILLILLLIAIDIYAFQALRTVLHGQQGLRWWIYGIYILISGAALIYIIAATNGWTNHWSETAQTYARAFVFIFYVSKLFPIFFLLLDDVLRLLQWIYTRLKGTDGALPDRRKFLSQMGWFIGAIPFTSLIYGVLRNPYRYKLYVSDVPIAGLVKPLNGLRIVQISDIHSGSFFLKEPIENAIRMVNAQEPDLVFFTGDMVNSTADEMEPYIELFSQIKAKHGIFSVMGNHDYGDYHQWEHAQDKADNLERLYDNHKRMGWQLLNNENTTLTINGESVSVIGIENSSASERFRTYGDLPKAMEGADAPLKLLLSHDPSYWTYKIVKDFPDIQLTLSGHTHGFQFGIEWPPYLRWSPSKYFYPQWAGLYRQGDQHLYVNRGFGFLGYPGRVGILPEITLLTLRSA